MHKSFIRYLELSRLPKLTFLLLLERLRLLGLKRALHRSRFRQRYRCVGRYDYVRVFTRKKCGMAVTERTRFSWSCRHYVEISYLILSYVSGRGKRTDFELCEWANCSTSVLVVA